MPDFSKPMGGWGAGKTATNATFYLAVFEEYAGCNAEVRRNSLSPLLRLTTVTVLKGNLGKQISVAYVPLIYNATA